MMTQICHRNSRYLSVNQQTDLVSENGSNKMLDHSIEYNKYDYFPFFSN